MYQITIKNGSKTQILHENYTDSLNRLSAGQIVEEVNQIPSFSFTVPASNPCYNDGLHDRKSIITVKNTVTNEVDFEGTLLTHKESMSSTGKFQKSAVCEGFLSFLCDTVQPYHHYENSAVSDFLQAILEVHNSQTSEDKHIFLGSCDNFGGSTASKTTAYRSTLDEIKENLISRLGGEIRVRRVNGQIVLDYLEQCGTKSDTVIELADNLKSLEISTDSTNVVTRLIPLGAEISQGETAERLTIAEVNDGKIYIDDENAIAKYGIIVGTVTFDDITVPANLKQRGQEYLAENNRVKKAYSAQVLDLSAINSKYENLKCGNTYRFKNSVMKLDEDLRLIKKTTDIFKPFTPTVEIGDKTEKITDIATRTAELIEYEIPKKQYETLSKAKSIATNLIINATTGYVVIRPDEILIMDTDNIETAQKVWRWNSGGLGYSNTGYNGEYGLAMTMNGQIVADFVKAGVLSGVEIQNGNDTFPVTENGKVTARDIEITGGSVNVTTSSENENFIRLNFNSCKSTFNPTGVSFADTSNNHASIVNINGIQYYDDFNDTSHTLKAEISARTGNISVSGGVYAGGNISGKEISGTGFTTNGTVYAETLVKTQSVETDRLFANTINFKKDDTYYSLESTINTINSNIQTLWNEVFSS